jgi:type II secretory ATPase GspE/PulE/Tfp pilus assembly ATPase PilB-like protein
MPRSPSRATSSWSRSLATVDVLARTGPVRVTLVAVGDSPVITLVNAILLAAMKKHATDIAIYATDGTDCTVEFTIDGAVHEEMRPERRLLAPIVRRLAIMASLPTYPRGMGAEGTIHLIVGDDRHAYFALYVEGHGDDMAARIRILPDDAPASVA